MGFRKNRRRRRIYYPLKPELYTDGMAILFPIAGILHDYELFRVYNRKEHPIMFIVKLLIYLYFTTILVVAWYMKNEKLYKVGNYSLGLCPLYCMIYSNYIFSHKFGPQGDRSQEDEMAEPNQQ
jgi:hypothetical protein